jgi:hypothetical protein
MGSRAHCHEGVAKASFSVNDLLDERFDFDRVALARLRQRAAEWEPRAEMSAEASARR